MPTIRGFHHLSLSVTDLEASTAWYRDVLGFEVEAEIDGATFRRVRLGQPDGAVILALTCHDDSAGQPFDERVTGMDHVALAVGSVEDVRAFKRRFEALGVEHSPIRSGETSAVITLRDPDNIQVEVFGADA